MALLAPDPTRLAPPATQASDDRAPEWVARGTPEPLRTNLIGALGAERVLTRAIDLVKYASDASGYRLIPKAVVVPRDVRDVVALLRFASESRTPLVFRAGGTSLNGQGQTDSVLVDVRRYWQRARVEEDGRRVRVQPGMVLGHVNRRLARHGRRVGPDPASTDIACVGGVIANNSGGMRCGVVADSYRTIREMTFVLANGAVIDTAAPDAEREFADSAPELAAGLIEIRDALQADEELSQRIRRKFEIKNTTGYRLCAFLDADTPLEIFRRLIVGSEGTLAFVAEAVFETVPHPMRTLTAMLLFENVDAAAAAVPPLVESGTTATELLVAPTLIAAAYNMPGVPEAWKALKPEFAALLVEFRSDEEGQLDDHERDALAILDGRELVEPPRFSRDPDETRMFWHVREGLHGLMAAMRPPGAMLLMEDVCVPPARVAEAAKDIPELLRKHGFLWGVAGHASAGNLHFTLTPNFDQPEDLERYEAFMNDLVELIVGKYDGSLKAEHGTGVNMAPYVEREWGSRATEMMWRVKQLADPLGILGPGIVLNRDPGVHLRNLKSTPEIEPVATKCIECGACEPVCPSRNVTTTPRQRIVVRREMARQPPGSPVLEALLEQYQYDAVQTCAADGTCGPACPVGIDTGKLIKELRAREHGERAEGAARQLARHYAVAERAARAALRLPAGALRSSIPAAAPARLPYTLREGAAAVYLPACVNRIFGNARGTAAHPTVPEAMVAISQRAGLPLWIPPDAAGHCCGMPWSSKGFVRANELMSERTTAAIRRWTDDGELKVVLDASSCTHALRDAGVEVLDSIEWVHDHLLERLELRRRVHTITVHPNCSAGHLGLGPKLTAIAARMADELVMPAFTGCCGMAGDRGWLHPELPASALREVVSELGDAQLDACVSSNRTCEAALQQVTGRDYRSFALVLEELTRP